MAGFIASETARLLMEQGHKVVGLDNFNDYYDPKLKRHRIETLRKKFDFEFHEIDIENSEGLAKLFRSHKFDTVYNLAARAGVRYSLEHPEIYFSTNTMGSLNLLNQMRDQGCQKFILASTSSLYAGEPLPFVETAAVNRPLSPYAVSKKAAEQIAFVYHMQYGLDCSILRYFTVYGPAGRPDMSVLRFLYWIDRGEEIQLFGDGEQSRDFTFVTDIARGTILAERPLGHAVINLGGGKTPVTINEMIKMMEKGLGKSARIKRLPAQSADVQDTQANIEKAKRVLGWQPEVDFSDGLAKTISWYQENREFVASLNF